MPPQTPNRLYTPLSLRKPSVQAGMGGMSAVGDPIERIKKGLAYVETRGAPDAYSKKGVVVSKGMYAGDRALGKYQVMGKNVGPWTKQYLGREVSPEEFLASPDLQEQLMTARAKDLYSKYGNEEDVASVHFTGQPLAKAGGDVADDTGTSNSVYQDLFKKGIALGGEVADTYQGATNALQGFGQMLGNAARKYTPLALRTAQGIPEAAGNLAKSSIEQTGKGLGIIDKGMGIPARVLSGNNEAVPEGFGEQIDTAYGLPGRLATGFSPAVPSTFSEQVGQTVDSTGASPIIGGVARLAAGVAEPAGLPDKVGDVAKTAPKVFEGFQDLSTKLLEKLKGRSAVSKQFISDLTNSPDLKQTEKDMFRNLLEDEGDQIDVPTFAEKVKAELLPLERTNSQSIWKTDPEKLAAGRGNTTKYESVSLPDELRGPVANYTEHIYKSPVKTAAGDVHFSGQEGADNYFGHTRVEDLPAEGSNVSRKLLGEYDGKEVRGQEFGTGKADGKVGTTRRVIEVQSDLFQKGRLEKEKIPSFDDVKNTLTVPEQKRWEELATTVPAELTPAQKLELDAFNAKIDAPRAKELAPLEPYKNNAAHFRMIREEVKQAAIDGKTKLQFPTGETAMKIEGLGQANTWRYRSDRPGPMAEHGGPNATDELTIADLVPGKEVLSGFDEWIITDVLGDGKFKAVSKGNYFSADELAPEIDKTVSQLKKMSDEELRSMDFARITDDTYYTPSFEEQFDISGKVDTENPIYRFYNKDVRKYLTSKYDAKEIVDPQGVSWIEVSLKPEYAKMPVEAFVGLGAVGLGTAATTPAINRKQEDN